MGELEQLTTRKSGSVRTDKENQRSQLYRGRSTRAVKMKEISRQFNRKDKEMKLETRTWDCDAFPCDRGPLSLN